MEKHLTQWFEQFLGVCPVFVIALFGGFARVLNRDESKSKATYGEYIAGLVTAAFVGLIVHWVSDAVGLEPKVKSIAIALGGYRSKDVLSVLSKLFIEVLNVKFFKSLFNPRSDK